MSLISKVLEGFDTGFGSGSYDSFALGTAATDTALLEAMNTSITVERAANSVDVVGAMKVVIEGTDVSPAMEGFFRSAIEKLVGAFETLKNVIVKWFNDAIKFFESMFIEGQKFADKFGKELRGKDTTGFEYLGYEWDEKKGNDLVKKIYGKIDDLINKAIGDLSKAAEMNSDQLSEVVKTKDGQTMDADDVVISCGIGVNNISQMKESINNAYHGGMTAPASDATITSAQVGEYLSYIAVGKKVTETVKNDQSAFESRLNQVINTLNSISNKDDKSGDKAKNAAACSKVLTVVFSVRKSAAESKVACLKSMLKAETSILRSFLNWRGRKPVQNSVDYDLAEMELLEATYPDLMPDFAVEENFGYDDYDDSYMESSYNDNSGDLFDQIANMIGI